MLPVTQLASANGTQTKGAQFSAVSEEIPQRAVLAFQFDPSKTEIEAGKLYPLGSPAETGQKFGYNTQLYMAHFYFYMLTGGTIPLWAIPVAPPTTGSPVAATGDILTFGGAPTVAGYAVFRVNGVKFKIPVSTDSTPTSLGDAAKDAINADSLVLLQNAGNTAGVVAATATFLGDTGNGIRVVGASDEDPDEEQLPDGLTLSVADPAGGVGDEFETLQTAYDKFASDPMWRTCLVDMLPASKSDALDYVQALFGQPEDGSSKGSGLWSDDDYKPATRYVGATGSYATVTGYTANRKNEMNNVIVAAADRLEMPFVAAIVAASRACLNFNSNACSKLEGQSVPIGTAWDVANDWTQGTDGKNKINTAAQEGVTVIKLDSDGNSILGDVVTTYRPDGLAYPTWQFEVDKVKSYNVGGDLKNDKVVDTDDVMVNNKAAASRQPKAVDADAELARIVSLAVQWEQRGLVYDAAFVIQNTTVKEGVNRFDRYVPLLLSGNKRVLSDTVYIDRNTALVGQIVNVG